MGAHCVLSEASGSLQHSNEFRRHGSRQQIPQPSSEREDEPSADSEIAALSARSTPSTSLLQQPRAPQPPPAVPDEDIDNTVSSFYCESSSLAVADNRSHSFERGSDRPRPAG